MRDRLRRECRSTVYPFARGNPARPIHGNGKTRVEKDDQTAVAPARAKGGMHVATERDSVVLFVGEAEGIVGRLARIVAKAGYQLQTAETIVAARRLVAQNAPFAVVVDASRASDHEQPWELCRELAEYADSLLIVVIGRSNPKLRTKAFSCGADQCFAIRSSDQELIAYLDARADHLKRAPIGIPCNVGEQLPVIAMEPESRQISLDGRRVSLSVTEFALLEALSRRKGRFVSRDELCRILWRRRDLDAARVLVKIYVLHLRRKLESDPCHPQYVLNVRGVGYRLGAATRRVRVGQHV